MSTASLNGQRVTSALVTVPKWGAWYADVGLDVERTIAGGATLKIADVSFVGTVLSGGPSNGRSSYRIVGGAGGWGKEIPESSEVDAAGVKVSTILTSVASAAGETLDASTVPDTRLGPHWTRHKGQARDALELVAPGGWYVGEDGVTRIGARASKAWAGKAAIEPVDKARGSVVLAPETLVGLTPGAIVAGVEAVDVWHAVADGKVRTTVWGSLSSSSSRRLTAWRQLFESLDPGWRFRGVYEYRVVLLAGDRLDIQPVRPSTGMPELRSVPVRPGLAGGDATLTLGSRVLVSFIDGDPSRPAVIGFEDVDGAGFAPSELNLRAGAQVGGEHVLTVEALTVILHNVLLGVGGVALPPALLASGVVTGIINAALAAAATPAPIGLVAQAAAAPGMAAAMLSGPGSTSTPYAVAIAALSGKVPNESGLFPSLGAAKVKAG